MRLPARTDVPALPRELEEDCVLDHLAEVVEVVLVPRFEETLPGQVFGADAVDAVGVGEMAEVVEHGLRRAFDCLRLEIVRHVACRHGASDGVRKELHDAAEDGGTAYTVALDDVLEDDRVEDAAEVFESGLVREAKVPEEGQAAVAEVESQARVRIRKAVEAEELFILKRADAQGGGAAGEEARDFT